MLRVIVGGVFVLFLASACGSSDPGAAKATAQLSAVSPVSTGTTSPDQTTTTSELPTPGYAGAITAPISYGDTGISLAVPPSSSQPSVSWEAAFQNCSTHQAICSPSSPITISLASATEKQAGQQNADGSLVPIMDNTLVYVISQSAVPCRPVGPARPTGNNGNPTGNTGNPTGNSKGQAGPAGKPIGNSGPGVVDSGQPTTTLADYSCTVLNFINANTGVAIYSVKSSSF